MTLQQLEYVIAVYRFKQFGKAADYCKVTQPTLSAMIQKLEEELGVKIFDRRKPLEVTAVGQRVVEQAWKVLVRAKKLKEIVEEEKGSLAGLFNIGILPTVAPYLIPLVFPKLMNTYPEMDIRITEMKTDDIKRALRHGDIDAGILAVVDGIEDFDMTTLYYEQFFAYIAKNDKLYNYERIKNQDLNGEFLWLLGEGHCLTDQLEKFCHLKSVEKNERAYRLGSIETFMRMVENGKGVTFIPELATLQLTDWQKDLVRPFAIPAPTRQVVMLTNKSFIRKSIFDIIVRDIRKAIPPRMLQLHSSEQRV